MKLLIKKSKPNTLSHYLYLFIIGLLASNGATIAAPVSAAANAASSVSAAQKSVSPTNSTTPGYAEKKQPAYATNAASSGSTASQPGFESTSNEQQPESILSSLKNKLIDIKNSIIAHPIISGLATAAAVGATYVAQTSLQKNNVKGDLNNDSINPDTIIVKPVKQPTRNSSATAKPAKTITATTHSVQNSSARTDSAKNTQAPTQLTHKPALSATPIHTAKTDTVTLKTSDTAKSPDINTHSTIAPQQPLTTHQSQSDTIQQSDIKKNTPPLSTNTVSANTVAVATHTASSTVNVRKTTLPTTNAEHYRGKNSVQDKHNNQTATPVSAADTASSGYAVQKQIILPAHTATPGEFRHSNASQPVSAAKAASSGFATQSLATATPTHTASASTSTTKTATSTPSSTPAKSKSSSAPQNAPTHTANSVSSHSKPATPANAHPNTASHTDIPKTSSSTSKIKAANTPPIQEPGAEQKAVIAVKKDTPQYTALPHRSPKDIEQFLAPQVQDTEKMKLLKSELATRTKAKETTIDQIYDINTQLPLLHTTILSLSVAELKLLIQCNKANLVLPAKDSPDYREYTPLHCACANKDLALAQQKAEVLLTQKIVADHINDQNANGDTPLLLAIENENDDLVQTLIKHGAQVGIQNNNKQTALMLTLEKHNNDFDRAIAIIEQLRFADDFNTDGASLLHTALDHLQRPYMGGWRGDGQSNQQYEKNRKLFQDVLNNFTIDINEQKDGKTVLVKALQAFKSGYINIDVIQSLLDKNADITIGTILYKPYSWEAGHQLSPLRWLIKIDQKNREPYQDFLKILPYIKNLGNALSDRDSNGDTVIHYIVNSFITDSLGINAKDELHNVLESLLQSMEKEHKQPLLNSKNTAGQTALHRAVEAQNSRLIYLFIGHKADLDIPDDNGNTPLLLACTKEGKDAMSIVSILANNRANTDMINQKSGKTPFTVAFEAQNTDTMATILSWKSGITLKSLETKNQYGDTPLLWASESSERNKLSKALIDAGANINAVNKSGYTVLRNALRAPYNVDLVNYICAVHNAKKQIIDVNTGGNNLLHTAYTETNGWMSNLDDKDKQRRNKAIACQKMFTAITQCTDLDLNSTDKEGKTVLMRACQHKHFPVLDILLLDPKKLTLDAKDNLGNTALYYAAQHYRDYQADTSDSKKAIEMLLKAGADSAIQHSDGWNLFVFAIHTGNTQLAKALVDKGMSQNHLIAQLPGCERKEKLKDQAILDISEKKHTPLVWSVMKNNKEMFDILIADPNLDVNVKDADNNTALHHIIAGMSKDYSTKATKKTMLTTLLQHKNIALDGKNKNNRTALHEAVLLNDKEVMQALIARGANVNITDQDNLTPLSLASKQGLTDMVAALLAEQCHDKEAEEKEEENNKTSTYTTALYHALANQSYYQQPNQTRIATLLIQANANPNALPSTLSENNHPMQLAVNRVDAELAQVLITNNIKIKQPLLSNLIQSVATKLSSNQHDKPATVQAFNNLKQDLQKQRADHNQAFLKVFTTEYENEQAKDKAIADALPYVYITGVDENGNTLLHTAATQGNIEATKYLLAKIQKDKGDANVQATLDFLNKDKQTAALLAIKNGHTDIAKLLIDRHTTLKTLPEADNDELTALHYAASSGQEDVVVSLLAKNIAPDTKGSKRKSALTLAAAGGHCPIVQQLLTAKANSCVTYKESNGAMKVPRMPLSYAAQGGHSDVVTILIESMKERKPADPKSKYKTAWDDAVHKQENNCVTEARSQATTNGYKELAERIFNCYQETKGIKPSAAAAPQNAGKQLKKAPAQVQASSAQKPKPKKKYNNT